MTAGRRPSGPTRRIFCAYGFPTLRRHRRPGAAGLPWVVEINDLLAARGDNRGTFSLVYAEILDKTIPALSDGTFRDPRWARALSVDFVERMREYYGVDMQPFFQLWLVGEVFGETTATTALFQSVRAVAWTNAVGLRLHERHARTKIDRTWRAAGVVLDGLEAKGKI